jgi:hypothetical protein
MANESNVVETNAANGATDAKDESHLLVVLSQKTYDIVQDVVKRATDRGLESSFDHWLADAITSGAKGRIRTWDDRDEVTLMKQVRAGNAKAIEKLQEIIKRNASQ